ncbi:MAG TPA: ABC transporter permease [Candidatus Dormibacteraeota bacterium]|nr:ABC transporter permease [Candidatus Dormibacteraeota bacterium]
MATSELPAQPGVRVSRPAQPSAWERNWELLRELIRRDLQSRHKGSTLGAGWSLLNPLLYMLVYTAVFSKFVRVHTVAPYPVYLLSALLAWNFFAQALTYSANSVLGNATLVKKVAFQWELLTVSSVTAAFINYLISLLLLVPLMLYYHVPVGVSLLVVPLIALITYALALGIGLLLAAGNVYFRDIEYLLGIAITVWFFMTPIIYSLDIVDPLRNPACQATGGVSAAAAQASAGCKSVVHGFHLLKYVLYVNPMTWIATAFQDAIANSTWPTHRLGLGYAAALAVVAIVAGYLLFRRVKGGFAEEL